MKEPPQTLQIKNPIVHHLSNLKEQDNLNSQVKWRAESKASKQETKRERAIRLHPYGLYWERAPTSTWETSTRRTGFHLNWLKMICSGHSSPPLSSMLANNSLFDPNLITCPAKFSVEREKANVTQRWRESSWTDIGFSV